MQFEITYRPYSLFWNRVPQKKNVFPTKVFDIFNSVKYYGYS